MCAKRTNTLRKFCVFLVAFDLTHGSHLPVWKRWWWKEAIDLAQKWEASRAALLQSLCNHNSSISQAAADALRNCSAAQKCNWRQDSLSLDLYHERHQGELDRIPLQYLMKLLHLHRTRRDKSLLDSDLFLVRSQIQLDVNAAQDWSRTLIVLGWLDLKIRIFMEMDKLPFGNALCTLDFQEVIACLDDKGSDRIEGGAQSCHASDFPRCRIF